MWPFPRKDRSQLKSDPAHVTQAHTTLSVVTNTLHIQPFLHNERKFIGAPFQTAICLRWSFSQSQMWQMWPLPHSKTCHIRQKTSNPVRADKQLSHVTLATNSRSLVSLVMQSKTSHIRQEAHSTKSQTCHMWLLLLSHACRLCFLLYCQRRCDIRPATHSTYSPWHHTIEIEPFHTKPKTFSLLLGPKEWHHNVTFQWFCQSIPTDFSYNLRPELSLIWSLVCLLSITDKENAQWIC